MNKTGSLRIYTYRKNLYDENQNLKNVADVTYSLRYHPQLLFLHHACQLSHWNTAAARQPMETRLTIGDLKVARTFPQNGTHI